MSTQDLEQYQRAISALHSQELDQTLEDQIDAEMARLNEEDFSDAAMEEAVFPQLVSARAEAEQVHVLPSEFTEFAQRIPVGGEITRFSFEGRRYLKQPYDTSANRILLKFSRQSEKSLVEHSMVLLADGSETPISEVRVGDWVVTMLPDGAHTSVSRVTWKSERYRKPCVRIRTQRCLSADAAVTHPFRRWGRWTPAGELKIGDRVATVRRAGLFTSEAPALADNHIKFVAYMIGDGCCGCSNNFSFTQQPGLVLDDFLTIAHQEQWPVRIADKSGTRAKQVHVGKITTARTWLKEGGLWLCRSADKALPAWVWDLPRTQAALFLNRLWSTDGSVLLHGHQYEIVYSSISRTLVRGVQRLLWKFGIPSRIRELHPQVYRGSNKCAYILAVQTQPGIVQFLTEVGALGKSEDIPLPSMAPNNNQDTFPVEITQDLHAVNASGGSGGRGRNATYSLSSAGLTATPSYPPSRRRLQEYVDFFRGHPRYDQNLVDQLAAHLDTDLYWDRVIGVEDIGEQWCYDIAIEEDESFVTDGLVTHNSTLLGNKLLAYAAIIPAFAGLYVSSSATQAQVFSVDRLKDPIELSPELGRLVHNNLSQNVLFKQFRNRSQIRIRYAFLHADRTRGIRADAVTVDEIQDILFHNIPVIEQCASHSELKLFCYSGTPKSLDNTIEVYWANHSTQNEWAVPCERHGVPGRPSSWHWNILGRANVGRTGPICAKCGAPIDPMHPRAQWVSLQPRTDVNQDRVTFEGYHVSQLMVPWVVANAATWHESIIFPLETYEVARVNNEVFGLSYDSGTRPVTRKHLEACCRDEISMDRVRELAQEAQQYGGVAAGIDWGGGGDQGASYTVLSLGGYLGHEFQIFFLHRFIGEDLDPHRQLLKIAQLLNDVQFRICGCDYGGGFHPNAWLERNFPRKVLRYQYAGNPKAKVKWEPALGRFILHRTEVMSDVFNALRSRRIWLPRVAECRSPYLEDVLNIFSEYSRLTNMTQYKISPGKSDDTLHSILYCLLASFVIRRRLDLIVPLSPLDVQLPQ